MGGEIFRTCPHRPWSPPSLLYNGHRVFPGGKERPRRDADPSSPSSSVVKNEYSYTPTPPMGRTTCTVPQCLYKGALYFHYSYVLHNLLKAPRYCTVTTCESPDMYSVFKLQIFFIGNRVNKLFEVCLTVHLPHEII